MLTHHQTETDCLNNWFVPNYIRVPSLGCVYDDVCSWAARVLRWGWPGDVALRKPEYLLSSGGFDQIREQFSRSTIQFEKFTITLGSCREKGGSAGRATWCFFCSAPPIRRQPLSELNEK